MLRTDTRCAFVISTLDAAATHHAPGDTIAGPADARALAESRPTMRVAHPVETSR